MVRWTSIMHVLVVTRGLLQYNWRCQFTRITQYEDKTVSLPALRWEYIPRKTVFILTRGPGCPVYHNICYFMIIHCVAYFHVTSIPLNIHKWKYLLVTKMYRWRGNGRTIYILAPDHSRDPFWPHLDRSCLKHYSKPSISIEFIQHICTYIHLYISYIYIPHLVIMCLTYSLYMYIYKYIYIYQTWHPII